MSEKTLLGIIGSIISVIATPLAALIATAAILTGAAAGGAGIFGAGIVGFLLTIGLLATVSGLIAGLCFMVMSDGKNGASSAAGLLGVIAGALTGAIASVALGVIGGTYSALGSAILGSSLSVTAGSLPFLGVFLPALVGAAVLGLPIAIGISFLIGSINGSSYGRTIQEKSGVEKDQTLPELTISKTITPTADLLNQDTASEENVDMARGLNNSNHSIQYKPTATQNTKH